MASATCENESCERGTWELRKRPSDYKGGGPECPDCGTTRVSVERTEQAAGGRQAQGQARQPQERRQPQRGQQGQAPARQQQAQGGSAVPMSGEPESAGDAVARSALALTTDEVGSREKAQAAKGIGQVILDGVSRFTQYKDKIEEKQEEHAKGVDLQKAEDKPRCVECGFVFSRIPTGQERVTCPECGEEYEVVRE